MAVELGETAVGFAAGLRAHIKKVLPKYPMGYQLSYSLAGDPDHALNFYGEEEDGSDKPDVEVLVALFKSMHSNFPEDFEQWYDYSEAVYQRAKYEEEEAARRLALDSTATLEEAARLEALVQELRAAAAAKAEKEKAAAAAKAAEDDVMA